MIRLAGVRYAYPGASPCLKGVDLVVRKGERVLLTGPSGAGKSTLLRLLAGLLEPGSGRVELQLSGAGERFLPAVAYVHQRPDVQCVAASVREEIALGLEYGGLPRGEIEDRVDMTLKELSLSALASRPTDQLSAGEMQRVAFAAAWVMEPELWLLDEPTAYLDPRARDHFHGLLKRIPEGSTVLHIPARGEVWRRKDRLLLLENGEITEDGGAGELFDGGRLNSRGVQSPVRWRLERAWRRRRTPPENHLPEPPGESFGAVDLASGSGGEPLLEARELQLHRRPLFGAGRQVLTGCDVTLSAGEVVALVGLSGAGKSSLLEVLAGVLKPGSGAVRWNGRPPEKQFGRIGFAQQFPERAFFAETVLEEVAFGPLQQKRSRQQALQRAREALAFFALDPEEHGSRRPLALSGGEARRVALASLMALEPVAYLLDEPTAGLGEEDVEKLAQFLRREAGRGCAILLAGHDVERFVRWCGRWLLLREGRITKDGSPREWWQRGEELWCAPEAVQWAGENGLPLAALPGLDVNRTLSWMAEGGAGRDPRSQDS